MSKMRKKAWILYCLMLLQCLNIAQSRSVSVQEKADVAIPITTMSPPEGNTTFIGGTTWCVGLAAASQIDLQNALDWACDVGRGDCKGIQEGEACYEPNTLLSHASYAFNTYYQQNGNSLIACNFGGTATITKNNPSYGKCVYSASGSVESAATVPPLSRIYHRDMYLKLAGIWLLVYSGLKS